MEQFDLYQDIARRTNGEIYIGVVGPVRTGKSTFIKKFLDMMVLPKVENPYKRDRILDEMPQSGAGRGIMTMQPNFVPNEAVELTFGRLRFRQGAAGGLRGLSCGGRYRADG